MIDASASRGRSKTLDGGDHNIKLGKRGVGQVEAAVLENVQFDAFENCKTAQPLVQAVDLAAVPCQPRGIKTMRRSTPLADASLPRRAPP